MVGIGAVMFDAVLIGELDGLLDRDDLVGVAVHNGGEHAVGARSTRCTLLQHPPTIPGADAIRLRHRRQVEDWSQCDLQQDFSR